MRARPQTVKARTFRRCVGCQKEIPALGNRKRCLDCGEDYRRMMRNRAPRKAKGAKRG